MNELPIFMSYRRADGSDLAHRLRDLLHGRTLMVNAGTREIPSTLSVYFDQAVLAGTDWESLHSRELARARALLVICTPGTMHEFENEDWVYREIRWWLTNRSTTPPILVTLLDRLWIPDIIHKQWPKAQFVKLDRDAWNSFATPEQKSIVETSVQSILTGISVSLRDGQLPEGTGTTNVTGLYLWEKDRQFRYIGCNENYARAAGYDSPDAMVGKTDDDMPWRNLADFFRAGDQQVFLGKIPRIHVQETEIMVDRVAEILVTENQLLDRRGECVGLTGYFIDITGEQLVPKDNSRNGIGKGLFLGKEFGDEYLSEVEVEIFKGILMAYSMERIGNMLNLSRGEVESSKQAIKRKLQCNTEGDLIATAIRSGLPLILFRTGKDN